MNNHTSAKFSLFGVQPMDERRSVIIALTQRNAALTGADVRQLRRALFEDEGVSRDEAADLFALERAQRRAGFPARASANRPGRLRLLQCFRDFDLGRRLGRCSFGYRSHGRRSRN